MSDEQTPIVDDHAERVVQAMRPHKSIAVAAAAMLMLSAMGDVTYCRHVLDPTRTPQERRRARGRCGSCGKKSYDCRCR